MNIPFNKYFIFLLIASFFLFSCTEKIEIDLNDGNNNRLVVEGSITSTPGIHTVKLSRTTTYFFNQKAPAELGATVTISDGQTVFPLSDTDNDGVYVTDNNVAGMPGRTYKLDITLKNGEQFSASSYMDSIAPLDSLSYLYSNDYYLFMNDYAYLVFLFAQETPGLGNAYQWNLYIDGVLESDTLREVAFTDDRNVDGSYIKDWPVYMVENWQIKKDTTRIGVEMRSMSMDQYLYNVSLMLETDWNGGMFQGPPANVPTNLNNGALGFFSANATFYKEILIFKGKNITK